MSNNKDNKKASKPSSLYHYTSFKALLKILNEESLKKQMISIRLNNPLQMNDKREVHFFEDYVFCGKIGEEMKQKKERFKKDIGDPYILSFIHHISNKGRLSHEIPMWWMYGDNYKGIRLRFDFKTLNEYCQSDGRLLLQKCQYETDNKMIEIGKKIRKSFVINDNLDELEESYKRVALYKPYDWEYENEWRMLKWCKIEEVKYDDSTGRFYFPIELPLNSLRAVEIGPNADKDYIKGWLNIMKEKLEWKESEGFKINNSNLQIR